MNPIPGMATFLTCHCGFLEVYLLDVNDLVQKGFTVARVADFFKEAEQTFLDSMPKFGLTPGDHLFVPTGVIPLVVATGAPWVSGTSAYGAYIMHYVLDKISLCLLSEGIRTALVSHWSGSMSRGLEKFWAEPGHQTAIKAFIEVWQQQNYASDDASGGFGH